jgi:hypothetical protein
MVILGSVNTGAGGGVRHDENALERRHVRG